MNNFTLEIDGYYPFVGVMDLLNPSVPDLPPGYFLAQMGEYQQAPSGNPAVIVLNDAPDTIFTRQWQYFVYACNPGMSLNAIIALMGDAKALFNNTGFGGEEQFNNYLTGNVGYEKNPRLDKLRTFSRAAHAVIDYSNTEYKVLTFNGIQLPPLVDGAVYPNALSEVHMGLYRFTPRNAPYMFMACNNFRTVPGGTTISPFANGGVYDWTVAPGEMFSFFPLVSWFPTVLSPKSKWTRVGSVQNPYRRMA